MQNATKDPPSEQTRLVRSPQRLYAFVVVALTVFVLGLILWRTPVTGYQANATIEISLHAEEVSQQADSIRRTIVSEEFLRQSLNSKSEAPTDSNSNDILLIQENLFLTASSSEDSRLVNFHISFVGRSEEHALNVVSRLAHHIVASNGGQTTTTNEPLVVLTDTVTNLLYASESEATAQSDVDNHLSSHFNTLRSAVDASEPEVGTPTEPALPFTENMELKTDNQFVSANSNSNPVASENNTINPKWLALNTRLKELKSRRADLLTIQTPDNPAVKSVSQQIQQLEAELAQVPVSRYTAELKENSLEPESDASIDSGGSQPEFAKVNTAALSETIDEYNRLAETSKSKRQDRTDIELTLPSTLEGVTSLDAVTARIIEHPHYSARVGGTPGIAKIFLLGIVSAAMGLVCALRTSPQTTSHTFGSKKEVEQKLGIPVVAVISASDDEQKESKPSRPGKMNFAVKICEVLLACILVAFILAAIFDSPFIADFAYDPFGAISESVGRAQKFLF